MKEVSIKEKARRYDKAIEELRDFYRDYDIISYLIDIKYELANIFPEVLEINDENIRKSLIEYFRWNLQQILNDFDNKEVVVWLEQQGGKNNAEDVDILYRFSFYSYKDEPNVLYLSGLYVNEKYRNKGIGTKILKVADEVAKSLNCHAIRLKTKKNSDAERLYQTHGYNSLSTEGKDEIWLEIKRPK